MEYNCTPQGAVTEYNLPHALPLQSESPRRPSQQGLVRPQTSLRCERKEVDRGLKASSLAITD